MRESSRPSHAADIDTLSELVAIGDAETSSLAETSRFAEHRRCFLGSRGLAMKPNRGADRAAHIAVTIAELERIERAAAAAEGTFFVRRRLDLRRGLGEAMKPLSVLVVEDDLMIGPLLAETLEGLGHEVCALEVDAAAAVAAARRCHPDLMIVDIGLGEASGIAVVREIIKEGFAPHVFVTGDLLRGLSLGPDVVLIQKPYRDSDLVAAIARAIGGRASREEAGLF